MKDPSFIALLKVARCFPLFPSVIFRSDCESPEDKFVIQLHTIKKLSSSE